MFYEFYLDVFFLENLMMNFCIIQMTDHVLGHRKKAWRAILAAAGASLLSCIMILLPVRRHIVLSAVLSFFSGCAMAAAGCWNRKRGELMHTLTVFWTLALVLGGIWQFLMQRFEMTFFHVIPIGYLVVRCIWQFRDQRRKSRQYLCDVKITHHEKSVNVKALLDSGNQLRQPGSKKPVQIVESSVITELLTEEQRQELQCMMQMEPPAKPTGTFTYIPFRTLGSEHDLMPLMVVDAMEIKHGEHVQSTQRILTAVSKRNISSSGEYQMILHPQILE